MRELTRFIDIREVSHRTALGKTSIYERIKSNEFRPIKLGRSTRFDEREIQDWIDRKSATRGDDTTDSKEQ